MRGTHERWVVVSAVHGVLVGSAAIGAINASWVAPVDGNWTNPTAWSSNPAFPNMDQPNPGDLYNVTIGAEGATPYTVSLGTDIIVSRLSISSNLATLQQIGGTLGGEGRSSLSLISCMC